MTRASGSWGRGRRPLTCNVVQWERLVATPLGVKRESGMDTIVTVLGVLGGWIALQWWVLPRLGIPT
jgi:hypothetical protein